MNNEPETFKMHISNELNKDAAPSISTLIDAFLNCEGIDVPSLKECHATSDGLYVNTNLTCDTKDKIVMTNSITLSAKSRYGITDIFYQPKKRPITVVKFIDGTTEVVRLKKGDTEDIHVAIMYAIMKHGNPNFNHDMKKLRDMVVIQDVSRK